MIALLLHLALGHVGFLVAPGILCVVAIVLLERKLEQLAIIVAVVALVWFVAGALHQAGYDEGTAAKQLEWNKAIAADQASQHDAIVAAYQHEQDLASADDANEQQRRHAAADYQTEVAHEDTCTAGAPLGADGLKRLLTVAGERR